MQNPGTEAGLIGRGIKIGTGLGETPQAVAQFRLDEAWRALQAELRVLGVDPAIEVAASRITLDDLADVVCQAVMRVLRNPDGTESEAAQIDDYSESRKHGDTSQDLYFTAAELRRLLPSITVATPNAGSLKYL